MVGALRPVGAFLALACLSWPAIAACSNRDFCTGWNAVCHRTLPRGAEPKECARRFKECLNTGCYFFNNPRARCKNNAEDLALTTSCQRRG
jgi:hypothetical protein